MGKIPSDFYKNSGFSLVDVIVGVALFVILFAGIFGAYQLGLKIVGQSKNKITATAITNEEIEKIKSLDYSSIGIQGGFPDGSLAATGDITLNNVTYFIERRVDYVVDSTDGVAPPDDDCPNDYKKVQIKVSWAGLFPGHVVLDADISPENLAQECADSGGILFVQVFDAYGNLVPSPDITIRDPTTDGYITSASPLSGQHYFALPAGIYKVVVTKTGYSTDRTYGTDEVTTPEKPHLAVLDGQITQSSFSIDKVSTFSVDTLSPWGQDSFSDSFDDQTKIASSSNIIVSGGQVVLDSSATTGFVMSVDIEPPALLSWDQFSFIDSEPLGTDILYQVYYFASPDWVLVPDTDLPGNSSGFDDSPVDLSGLNPSFYPELRVRADFSAPEGLTPALDSWQVSWKTSAPTPISNITFNLQGEKVIGQNASGDYVYKYSQDHTSDTGGHIDIANLEWDNYTFSVDPSTGLDLVGTDPSPQPISLLPDTPQSVQLFLDAQNSLLVTVQDSVTLEPVFSAQVRLYNTSLGYDEIKYTDSNGQTLFIPLQAASYSIEVQAANYASTTDSVTVSGDNTRIINLERIE